MNAEKRKRFLTCLLSVFAWGFASHGFAFFNHFPTHDALTEMDGEKYGHAWKIALGRVFVPAYRDLTRGGVTLPLVIGLLALLYLAVSLYLITDLFEIRKSSLIILTAGILSVNLTVMANIATYLSDFDCNMFALLMAVVSIVLLKKKKLGFLVGMIPLCITLGIYQCYISVALTLFLFLLIRSLLKGEEPKTLDGLFGKGIVMILGSGVLYIVCLKLFPLIYGVALESDSPNSLGALKDLSFSALLVNAGKSFLKCGYELLLSDNVYPETLRLVLHGAFYLLFVIAVVRLIRKNKLSVPQIVLTLILSLMLPFAMNVSYILQGGSGHDLMYYAFWMMEFFALLIWSESIEEKKKGDWIRLLLPALSVLILWGNVRTANTLYLKKKMEYDANIAFFTGILTRMEECEGYEESQTEVVFVEQPYKILESPEEFDNVHWITGAWNPVSTMAGSTEVYEAFFSYVLLHPIEVADRATISQMTDLPEVMEMPTYPAIGSIKMVDGVLVVKLGQPR